MFRIRVRPRGLLATIAVVIAVVGFVRLGVWQLERREERRAQNAVGESRLSADPVGLDVLVDAATDLSQIEYRIASVAGVFDSSEEMLIRSQVELGQAGFHVITPLVLESGDAVLVNRGWVPLAMDRPPVDAAPPSGQVEFVGWVHLTQERPPLGPREPAGHLDVLNRVDIRRIADQVDKTLAPVYIVALGQAQSELPIPVDPPDFNDEGPHLSYAIQWFAFAGITLVGFFFLARSRVGRLK